MTAEITVQCIACKAELTPAQPGQGSITCPVCGREMTAYEAGTQEVRAHICQSALINAIGCYRRVTGADLGMAKHAVT